LAFATVAAAAGHAQPFGSFATALDGDTGSSPALATASASRRDSTGFTFELLIRYGGADAHAITVRTTRCASRMFARDLDGDSDRDLVVESFDFEPIAVLLNDGGGQFHQAPLDQYIGRLRRPDPQSVKAPEREDDSPDTGECPACPADADASDAAAPVFVATPANAGNGRRPVVLWHPVSATRGPPSTF
jgi:hypothetical protein